METEGCIESGGISTAGGFGDMEKEGRIEIVRLGDVRRKVEYQLRNNLQEQDLGLFYFFLI